MTAREVTPRWVSDHTQHRLHVVDVRDPFERLGELGHIPGSENVPLRQLARAVSAWPRDRPIIVVDADGVAASEAASRLRALGFSDVSFMSGGMSAWRAACLPVAFAPEPMEQQ